MGKQTIRLGDLVSALYEEARRETSDDDKASYLTALSTFDLLLHSDNERLAALLLSE